MSYSTEPTERAVRLAYQWISQPLKETAAHTAGFYVRELIDIA